MTVIHKAMQKFMKEPRAEAVTINETKATWQCKGPFNLESLPSSGAIGRIESLWADPDNSNIILLGSASNGIWKTTNGGSSWTRLNPDISGGVTDIAVHPTNKNIIYITTGIHKNGFDSRNYATGIWKSTNGGSTWYQRNGNLGLQAMYIRKIIISSYNPNILFALAADAVYKTTNGGLNWSLSLSAGTGQSFHDIVFDPQISGTYVYVSGDNCFYYTNTLGGYWVNKSSTISSGNGWRFAIDCTTGHKLFGYYRNYSTNKNELLVSNAQSISWSRYTVPYPPWTHVNIDIVLKAFSNGDIFVGAVHATKYHYNGTSISNFYSLDNIHDDCRAFAFPNNNASLVYAGTDGGISKNISSYSNEFTEINGNLALNECYDVAIYENDANMFLIGCHDNSTFRKSTTSSWKKIFACDGGICAIDKTNTNRIYCMINKLNVWSTNAGQSRGYSNLPERSYNSPFTIHPTSPNILYAAYFDPTASKAAIVKSTDYGHSYDLANPVGLEWGLTTAFEISQSHPNIMLFATYDVWGLNYGNLRRTTNAGASWISAENGMETIINNAYITDMYIQRNNSSKAWVCYGGFEAGKRVYKSTNGGCSWTNISWGLPNLPVNSIIYDDERGYLYVATDVGVYCLKDGTSLWKPLGTGMPTVMVTKLQINFKYDQLVASTYGAGVWTYYLGVEQNPIGSKNKSGKIAEENYGNKQNTEVDILSNKTLSIIPNPVVGTSIIKINDETIGNGIISIYTLDGKKVTEYNVTSQNEQIYISTNQFKEGVYFVIFEKNGQKISSQRMIIINN